MFFSTWRSNNNTFGAPTSVYLSGSFKMKQFLRIQLLTAISSDEISIWSSSKRAGDFPKFIGIVLHQMKNSPNFGKEN
jgi:hypothetical protein